MLKEQQIRQALSPKACGIQSLSVGVLKPITMTIRICPGAFGVELCPVNRNQEAPEIYQNH